MILAKETQQTQKMPLNIIKHVENFQCIECDSKITGIVEIEEIKSAEKVKRHICLNCGSPNIVITCPKCGSIGLVEDESRQEIYCKDCGAVLDFTPPYYKDFIKLRPYLQGLLTYNKKDEPSNEKYPGRNIKTFKKAEKDVLGIDPLEDDSDNQNNIDNDYNLDKYNQSEKDW